MSNPTISKTQYLNLSIDPNAYPQSFLVDLGVCGSDWQRDIKKYYEVEEAEKYVRGLGLNVVLREGVNIPAKFNYNPLVRNRKDDKGNRMPVEDMLAATSKQGAVFRKTDLRLGSVVASAIYSALPDKGTTFSKAGIYNAARQIVGVSGGPILTMGRLAKHLPKQGYTPPQPITMEELERGFQGMGLGIKTHKFGPAKTLMRVTHKELPGDRDLYVRLNAKASTGYPTQCKIETPEAKEIILNLVEMIDGISHEEEDDVRYQRLAIRQELRKLDHQYPYLFLSQGKVKADVYKASKINDLECRFYAVVPAAPKLVMQRASQALERDKLTVKDNKWEDYRDNTFVATFSGLSLGPKDVKLITDCMEFQMAHREIAFMHMGDDTMVAKRFFTNTDNEVFVRFALDATAFDLTQSKAVNAPIDARLAEMLEGYDIVAAELYKYMTSNKRVTLLGSLVVEMNDASLSGFPCVSIKNGVLMHILLERLVELINEMEEEIMQQTQEPSSGQVEAAVAFAVESVGRSLGFKIKLEQYVEFKGVYNFTDTLLIAPEKFVGYFLYVEENGGIRDVRAVWDTERALAQLKHPAFKWIKDADDCVAVNTVRVAATMMAVCDPLPDMAPAIRKGQKLALDKLMELIERVAAGEVDDPYTSGGAMDEDLMVLQEDDLGLEVTNYEKSLVGLHRALSAVIEKNDILATCREMDIPFVRSTKEEQVVGSALDEDVVKLPRTRRYIQIEALAENRPVPQAKHIGRQPPTTVRHAPRLKFGTKGKKTEREDRYESSDDDDDYDDQDGDDGYASENTADFEERQYQKTLDKRDDDVYEMEQYDSVQQRISHFVG